MISKRTVYHQLFQDIENKILTYDDTIIYSDSFFDFHANPAQHDNFIIEKKGCDAIYYKDVIDYLIRIHFIRNDCDHRFLLLHKM